jgi:ABC-type nitrate/sulfonate/bicarbonate transport system permease component
MNRTRLEPAFTAAALVVVLELLTRTELIPPAYLPPPSRVIHVMGIELTQLEFWAALGTTLQGWGLGLLIAILIAVPIGLLIGTNEYLEAGTRPIIEFLRPIPSVALIPLAILIYGVGLKMTLFLVVYAASWPLMIHAIYGMRDVDPILRDTARSYSLDRWARLRHVILPSAAPYVLTGVRISSATALILTITAELVVAAPGIGGRLNLAQTSGAIDELYGLIAMTGIVGFLLNSMIRLVEKRLIPWHASVRVDAVAA